MGAALPHLRAAAQRSLAAPSLTEPRSIGLPPPSSVRLARQDAPDRNSVWWTGASPTRAGEQPEPRSCRLATTRNGVRLYHSAAHASVAARLPHQPLVRVVRTTLWEPSTGTTHADPDQRKAGRDSAVRARRRD